MGEFKDLDDLQAFIDSHNEGEVPVGTFDDILPDDFSGVVPEKTLGEKDEPIIDEAIVKEPSLGSVPEKGMDEEVAPGVVPEKDVVVVDDDAIEGLESLDTSIDIDTPSKGENEVLFPAFDVSKALEEGRQESHRQILDWIQGNVQELPDEVEKVLRNFTQKLKVSSGVMISENMERGSKLNAFLGAMEDNFMSQEYINALTHEERVGLYNLLSKQYNTMQESQRKFVAQNGDGVLNQQDSVQQKYLDLLYSLPKSTVHKAYSILEDLAVKDGVADTDVFDMEDSEVKDESSD